MREVCENGREQLNVEVEGNFSTDTLKDIEDERYRGKSQYYIRFRMMGNPKFYFVPR